MIKKGRTLFHIFKKYLYVVDGEVSSAQADVSFFSPSVENLRNGETSFADVASQFFHVDE